MIERRSLLIGLGALFAAPAIVKASSLMKIAPTSVIRLPRNDLLWINEITRESVKLFKNSNAFIEEIDEQYVRQFGAEGAKIGDTLRIRMPADYVVSYGPGLTVQDPSGTYQYVTIDPDTQLISLWDRPPVPKIPDQLALAAVTVAAVPVLLEKPVTRRFWKS